MLKNKQLIIFDLDGVLIDSISNMKIALKNTSDFFKIKIKFNDYKKHIGLPFEQIMKNIGVVKNISLIKKKYIYFSNKNLKKIIIKKNDISTLNELKKFFFLAVFTSKDFKRTSKILSKYKLFDYVLTSDDVKKGKPHPEGIEAIIKFFSLKKKDAVFIGDSIFDYKCSLNSKIDYIHANWGYHKLKNQKKVLKLNKLNNLIKFL